MRRLVICVLLIALLPRAQVASAASLMCGQIDTNGSFVADGMTDGQSMSDCPTGHLIWVNDESPLPSLTLEQGVQVGGASFLFIGFCWAMGYVFTAMGKVS